MIEGMGPNQPTTVNERGARQSDIPYRFDLIDAKAMAQLAKVMSYGAGKYGVDNWRGISVSDHLNHMLAHAYAWFAGDYSDEHLQHAFCRAMMALAVDLEFNEKMER